MIKSDESDNSNLSIITDKIPLMKNYIQLNLAGFQHLRNKNFVQASKAYKKCIFIAQKLENDDIKVIDSYTNFSVALYFCGKFTEAKRSLEEAFRYSNRLYQSQEVSGNILNIHLRVLCNLCMIYATFNQVDESKKYFSVILNILDRYNESPNERLIIFHQVVYTFFRMESLTKFYEENERLFDTEDKKQDSNQSNLNPQLKASTKTLFALHKFLKDNDPTLWISVLKDEGANFKSSRDVNGFIFTIINKAAANFITNGKISETDNENFNYVIKNLNEKYQNNKNYNFKEKSNEKILSEMKCRIELCMEFYRRLYQYEEKLMKEIEHVDEQGKVSNKDMDDLINVNPFSNLNYSDQQINLHINHELVEGNKVLIKLFMKHCLHYLESSSGNQDTITMNHIDLSLKLLESNEVNFSGINILSIDSDIIKSLKNLHDNLVLIREKMQMFHMLNRFKYNTLGFSDRSLYLKQKYEKNIYWFQSHFERICQGSELTKVNYNSTGKVEHFYELDPENKCLKIYKSTSIKEKDEDKYKTVSFDDIDAVSYGIATDNLKKKFKSIEKKELNKPWLFLSLVMDKRSIDWYMDEDKLRKWFYGLKYYIKENNMIMFVPTTTQYLLMKYKMQMINKLKEYSETQDNEGKNLMQSYIVLEQLRNYINNNEYGFQSLPFVKVLLLYQKIKNSIEGGDG